MKESEKARRTTQAWISGLHKMDFLALKNMEDRIRDDLQAHQIKVRLEEIEIRRKLAAVEKELKRKAAIQNAKG